MVFFPFDQVHDKQENSYSEFNQNKNTDSFADRKGMSSWTQTQRLLRDIRLPSSGQCGHSLQKVKRGKHFICQYLLRKRAFCMKNIITITLNVNPSSYKAATSG